MALSDFTSRTERRERRDFTASDVLNYLSYEHETGIFRWKVRIMCHAGGKRPGDVAGSKKDGYIQINIFGRAYRAHHLAWLISYGEWPDPSKDVDHIDRDRSNNAILNLRSATRSQNNLNSSKRRASISGFRGVGPVRDKWFARIKANGKEYYLGTFSRKEDAINARIAAEKYHHGEFAE